MEMNLDTFLLLQRRRLEEDRSRLSARTTTPTQNPCPVLEIMQTNRNIENIKCNRTGTETDRTITSSNIDTSSMATSNSVLVESVRKPETETPQTFTLYTRGYPDENENAATLVGVNLPLELDNRQGGVGGVAELSKNAKEWVNQKELYLNLDNFKENNQDITTEERNYRRGKKDDMEQWVSDTFYSYFPGFNNEYQKRQNLLRERQQEYQQSLLKQQMSQQSLADKSKLNSHTARSYKSNASHTTDKTDVEIIVNNPDYVPPKHTNATRPGSTRHKLLQDLRHTELSHIIGGDGAVERNQRNAELETARKKDYQRELMQQIEDKRRSIEVLREKERRQEEALTRRMQEQLKTVQLQEQLEKEKMRADKLQFDSEQNRLMREHLLAKLENDTKLLYANTKHKSNLKTKIEGDVEKDSALGTGKSNATATNNSNNTDTNNKVYKYFSNSARHEYRRGHPLPADVELNLEIPELAMHSERECFHLSEKVCPMCDAPLKSYESCCLRCQRKLSLTMKVRKPKAEVNGNNGDNSKNSSVDRGDNEGDDDDASVETITDERSFALVCTKCERFYTLCPTCLLKSDVCRACHRKRNVCMSCRRTLCSFCLEEIACGRDTERSHVNERQAEAGKQKKLHTHKNDTGSERSFQVLEVNYANDESELSSSPPVPATKQPNTYANPHNVIIHNNLHNDVDTRPPYSINIERNSIFHPDYKPESFEQLPKVVDKQLSFDLDSSPNDEQTNMERVRKETDRRLSRYLKNYGDMAQYQRSKSESRHRGTQTTPETLGRRDVVMNEEHNLSMPLLREMPKLTRQEVSTSLLERATLNNQRKIDHLKRRWEIPAVQKFTISSASPRVLTQVGAIRKQLQADRLLLDNDHDDDDDY